MKKYLLNHEYVKTLLKEHKIVVVDGGARGELFSPFNRLDKDLLRVLRFEPDANSDVVVRQGNDMVFRKALWNRKTELSVNIAVEPASSSVYPFNRKLQEYLDPYLSKRVTAQVETVEAVSLDELVKQHSLSSIDFIKLDIHGAEYETLEGSSNTLSTTLGLQVESWVVPIHKGQKLRAHVEALVFDHGFYAFEEKYQAVWGRMPTRYLKKQPVALDTVYFKDPLLDELDLSTVEAVKLVGFANLYGHHAYAEQLTIHFHKSGIIDDELRTVISQCLTAFQPGFIEKIRYKVKATFSRMIYDDHQW